MSTKATAENPNFQIMNVIGTGGMGVVYAVKQTSLDRRLALKQIKPKLAGDARQRGQFITEAAVTSILSHPNIPSIVELGLNNDGAPFYAMEEITGLPWSRLISGPARYTTSMDVAKRQADTSTLSQSEPNH